MNMKILIYGSKGWIGKQFVNILNASTTKVDYVCGSARCDDYDSIVKEIDELAPTHIISFIGRTHGRIGDKNFTTIDYLEQNGKLLENVRDNLYSPFLLATIAKHKGIHYTYLGTGCIFAYDDLHKSPQMNVSSVTSEFIKTGVLEGASEAQLTGFTEGSKPNFFGSSYSTVKGFTDKIMHLYEDSVLNLRIRMPITGHENSRNFITKITTYDKICSIPNSMTVLPELLPIVLDMMKNKTTGTMNLTNPGVISHNEILEMYKEIVDPKFKWKNFTKEEQRAIIASDRSNNYLDTTRLETLYPYVNNIKVAVRKCLLCYKIDLYWKNHSVLHNGDPVKEMNLLITGGCGFIGSNFINYYFNKYVENTSSDNYKLNKLVNIDAMYYCASKDNVLPSIQSDPKYVFINGNICETSIVNHILEYYKITHVIHFAAQSHVDNSFEDSIKFTHDNILGTHILLECCRKYGKLNKFIHVSTDEVYGESMNFIEEHKKTEHSILCPTNPYAATKAGAELIAQSYNHSYKMPIIITRGNNVYGPNQYPEKIIPKFIKLLKEDKKLTIQGDGSSVRAFLHAIDTAKAFELILHKGEIGEIYNIGCDEGMEYSVMDVAKILIKMIKNTDNYSEWIEFVQDRPFNDMRYYISNEKLKKFGWEIGVDLMSGLKQLTSNPPL